MIMYERHEWYIRILHEHILQICQYPYQELPVVTRHPKPKQNVLSHSDLWQLQCIT